MLPATMLRRRTLLILFASVLLVGGLVALRRPTRELPRPTQKQPKHVPHSDPKLKGKVELTVHTDWQKRIPHHLPLDDPKFLPASVASSQMRPKDFVLGLRDNGKSWAIPWWVLKNHHVANFELDRKPYVVTFCERCTGAAAFDPVVDGRRLHFRVGGLYKGTPLLVDDETGSFWDIFAGKAFRGALAGRTLPGRPIVQSVWMDWVAANPETLVVDGTGEPRDGHGAKHYPGDPRAGRGLFDTILELDERLPSNALVLGVTIGGSSRCYPLAELDSRGGIVEDVVGGQRIVAVKWPGSLESLAFGRSLGGREVSLRFDGGKLVDVRTGSDFNVFGEVVEGPLAGKKLSFVRSGIEEFNTWAAHHPGTEIFGWKQEQTVAADPSR